MKIKTMLDCWASIVILRAGGCYEVPTLDAATGAEERVREWIEQAHVRMDGWHQADKRGELYHDEAVDLSVADVLLKILEGGAPKLGRGRPIQTKTIVSAIGARGPATTLLAAMEAESVIESFCVNTDESLPRVKQAVLKCHPRKGIYSGLGQKETARQWKFDERHRGVVRRLVAYGTLVLREFEPVKSDFENNPNLNLENAS